MQPWLNVRNWSTLLHLWWAIFKVFTLLDNSYNVTHSSLSGGWIWRNTRPLLGILLYDTLGRTPPPQHSSKYVENPGAQSSVLHKYVNVSPIQTLKTKIYEVSFWLWERDFSENTFSLIQVWDFSLISFQLWINSSFKGQHTFLWYMRAWISIAIWNLRIFLLH